MRPVRGAIAMTTPRDTPEPRISLARLARLPSHARSVSRFECYRGEGEIGYGTGVTLGDRFDVALQAARLGDEAAFERLYRDTAPLVIGYARARGARDPEDVAQEVFTAMATKVGSFVGDERAFRSW